MRVRIKWKKRQPIDMVDAEGDYFRDAEHHTTGAAAPGAPRGEVILTWREGAGWALREGQSRHRWRAA